MAQEILSKSDIKLLRQLRNLLTVINVSEIDDLLERAEGKKELQPRKRANLKEIRKQEAREYLMGKKKTA
jgi:glutaredoxin 2